MNKFSLIRAKEIDDLNLVDKTNYPLQDGTQWSDVWSITHIGTRNVIQCIHLNLPGKLSVGLKTEVKRTIIQNKKTNSNM